MWTRTNSPQLRSYKPPLSNASSIKTRNKRIQASFADEITAACRVASPACRQLSEWVGVFPLLNLRDRPPIMHCLPATTTSWYEGGVAGDTSTVPICRLSQRTTICCCRRYAAQVRNSNTVRVRCSGNRFQNKKVPFKQNAALSAHICKPCTTAVLTVGFGAQGKGLHEKATYVEQYLSPVS